MNTNEIIKILIAVVLTAFARPVVEAYLPSKEKIRAYVRKTLIFTGSYLIPAGILLNMMLDDSPIDKGFVFKIVIFTGVIMLHTVIDLFNVFARRTRSHLERITDLEEMVLDNTKSTGDVVKLIDRVVTLVAVKEQKK